MGESDFQLKRLMVLTNSKTSTKALELFLQTNSYPTLSSLVLRERVTMNPIGDYRAEARQIEIWIMQNYPEDFMPFRHNPMPVTIPRTKGGADCHDPEAVNRIPTRPAP